MASSVGPVASTLVDWSIFIKILRLSIVVWLPTALSVVSALI